MGSKIKKNRIILKITLVLASMCFALLACEIVLHLLYPYRMFRAGYELQWMRNNANPNLNKLFRIDPLLGFSPILGTTLYNEWGTLANGYALAKPAGVKRALFIGDSITSRGRIVGALRAEYGDQGYEYWNAGVESYNTVQEVNYYKLYNWKVNPDHVVLTFCHNDFETTPIAFFNEQNKLVVYSPKRSSHGLSPWLFKTSMLYRIWLGLSGKFRAEEDAKTIVQEVRGALRELRDRLAEKKIAFTVVIVPYLDDISRWPGKARAARENIMRICLDLQIAQLDLYPALLGYVSGWRAMREADLDLTHPSAEAARLMAGFMHARHLLGN